MEAIGQLTGGVAHDFNNMLRRDDRRARSRAKRRLRARRFAHTSATSTSAARAARARGVAHRRLLAFARQQPLAAQPIDAGKPDGRHVRPAATRRSASRSLSRPVAGAGPVADPWPTPHQLESALLNIALNARDAMPDGGRLTIETGNAFLDESYCEQNVEVEPGQYVMIAISDTGRGMPPDVRRAPSIRSSPPSRPGRAPGLGLSPSLWLRPAVARSRQIYCDSAPAPR